MKRKIATLEDLKKFAKKFVAAHRDGAIVGLRGELGAGKTEFVRSVVEVLRSKKKIPPVRVTSPSFTLLQSYALKPNIYHLDLYRLDRATAEALAELGYDEIVLEVKREKSFLFVEWPERADSQATQLDFTLKFELKGKSRTIEEIR